jgi:ABC-type branched-subunit amino acid transport system substrate-binding protein
MTRNSESSASTAMMSNSNRPPIGTAWAAWTAAALVIAVALLSTFTLGKPERLVLSGSGGGGQHQYANNYGGTGTGTVGGGPSGGSAVTGGTGTGTSGGSAGGPGATTQSGGHAPTAAKVPCVPGKNGGPTDIGVTGNEIKLAATVVKSGAGAAFLGDVEYGMYAIMNKQNQQGGICGRQLSLKLVDDGWSPRDGENDIRSFIQDGYFALAVVPSSEGLRAAINDKDIDNAGIPVVGTDGMLLDQYTDPWVWPVATSTNSFMHVIAKSGYDRGARKFGIVWENNYRFGVEGHAAFAGAVQRLGGQIPSGCDVQITGDQGSYSNQVSNFNSACDQSVDYVALLMEPETAATWVHDGGYLGTNGKAIGAAGPQTLFTYNFATNFAANCDQSSGQCSAHFWVWTGFKPPIPPYDTDPNVERYVNAMNATNSSADHYDQFVEGGYVGMELLVQALQKIGAAQQPLTRANVRATLDAMDFTPGLTGSTESFRPGRHFANTGAQAFSLVLSGNSFSNFRYEQTGFITDPWVGQDVQGY